MRIPHRPRTAAGTITSRVVELLGKRDIAFDLEFTGEFQARLDELAAYAYNENRYKALKLTSPEMAEELMKQAEIDVKRRWEYLKHLAKWKAV